MQVRWYRSTHHLWSIVPLRLLGYAGSPILSLLSLHFSFLTLRKLKRYCNGGISELNCPTERAPWTWFGSVWECELHRMRRTERWNKSSRDDTGNSKIRPSRSLHPHFTNQFPPRTWISLGGGDFATSFCVIGAA